MLLFFFSIKKKKYKNIYQFPFTFYFLYQKIFYSLKLIVITRKFCFQFKIKNTQFSDFCSTKIQDIVNAIILLEKFDYTTNLCGNLVFLYTCTKIFGSYFWKKPSSIFLISLHVQYTCIVEMKHTGQPFKQISIDVFKINL